MRTIKNKSVRGIFAAGLFAASAFLGAGSLSAQTVKTLYVHGVYPKPTRPSHLIECHKKTYGTGTCKQANSGVWWPLYTNGSGYWKPKANDGKSVFVGYDGRIFPTSSNSLSGVSRLLDALNTHCRKDQNKHCRIVSHSMGGLVTGKVLRSYAAPYNIVYHTTLSSAQNGSTVAEIALAILSGPLSWMNFARTIFPDSPFHTAVYILTRPAARLAYNHNISNGVTTYSIAAMKQYNWTAILHKGRHDQVVAYSSQCGYPRIAKFKRCGGEDPGIGHPYVRPYTGHKNHPWVSRYGVNNKVHMAGNPASLTQWFNYNYSSSLK